MKIKLSLAAILIIFLSVSATFNKKHPLLHFKVLEGFAQIPAGEVFIDSEKRSVEEFFIAKNEVSNQQYQTFLQDLKENGSEESFSAAQIKSKNWQKLNIEGNLELEKVYHTYSGFAHFPVVNVSWEGAQLYCQWLTSKIKQEIPSNYEVEFRLPTRNQWIRAARGDTRQTYAWNSPYLRDPEGKFLCNFKKLSAEHITFNNLNNTYEVIIRNDKAAGGPIFDKVGTYKPNAFGVYNMCGNAAEMITEEGKAAGGSFNSAGYDVRVESIETFDTSSPLVGFRPIMILKKK